MIGTAEQSTEKIPDAHAELGIARFIGRFDSGGLPPARVHESIARLATEIAPLYGSPSARRSHNPAGARPAGAPGSCRTVAMGGEGNSRHQDSTMHSDTALALRRRPPPGGLVPLPRPTGSNPGSKLSATEPNSEQLEPALDSRIRSGTARTFRLGAGRSQVQILSPRSRFTGKSQNASAVVGSGTQTLDPAPFGAGRPLVHAAVG
jgi:hypothetical protein